MDQNRALAEFFQQLIDSRPLDQPWQHPPDPNQPPHLQQQIAHSQQQQQPQPPQPSSPPSQAPENPVPAVPVDPDHVLVPLGSLTSSPTSSTGSASILEWHSDAESAGSGEMLDLELDSAGTGMSEEEFLPSSDAESDGSAPVVISRSYSSSPSPSSQLRPPTMEMSFSLPSVPIQESQESAHAPVPAVVPDSNIEPSIELCEGEGTPAPALPSQPQPPMQVSTGADVDGDAWTSLFGGLMPPAPMGFGMGMDLGLGPVPPVPASGSINKVSLPSENGAQDRAPYDAAYDGATKLSIPPGFDPASSRSFFERTVHALEMAFMFPEDNPNHWSNTLPSPIANMNRALPPQAPNPTVIISERASNFFNAQSTPSLPVTVATGTVHSPSRVAVAAAVPPTPATPLRASQNSPDASGDVSISGPIDTDIRPLRMVVDKMDGIMAERKRESRVLERAQGRQSRRVFIDDSEEEEVQSESGDEDEESIVSEIEAPKKWKGKEKAIELSEDEHNSEDEGRSEDEEPHYKCGYEYQYEPEPHSEDEDEGAEAQNFELASKFGLAGRDYDAPATTLTEAPSVSISAPLETSLVLEAQVPSPPVPSPLVASSLFKTLIASSPASSRPDSPFEHPPQEEEDAEDIEAGVISIAEYFKLKALSSSPAVGMQRTTTPATLRIPGTVPNPTAIQGVQPVIVRSLVGYEGEPEPEQECEGDGDSEEANKVPPRPDSANSGLSYFSGRRSASPSSPSPSPSQSPPPLSPPLSPPLAPLHPITATLASEHPTVVVPPSASPLAPVPIVSRSPSPSSPYQSYGYLPLTQTPEPRNPNSGLGFGLGSGLGSPVFGDGRYQELASPEPAFHGFEPVPDLGSFAPPDLDFLLTNVAGMGMSTFAPPSPMPVLDPFMAGAGADAGLFGPRPPPPPDPYSSTMGDGLFESPSPALNPFHGETGMGADLFGTRAPAPVLNSAQSESEEGSEIDGENESEKEASPPLEAEYPLASAGTSPYSSRSNSPGLLSRCNRESFLDYQDSRASSPEEQQQEDDVDEEREPEEQEEQKQSEEEGGSVHLHRISSFEFPRRAVPGGNPNSDRNHGINDETFLDRTPSPYVASQPAIPPPPALPAASAVQYRDVRLPPFADLYFPPPTTGTGNDHPVPPRPKVSPAPPPAVSTSKSVHFSVRPMDFRIVPGTRTGNEHRPEPPHPSTVVLDRSPSPETEEEELIRSFVSSPLISSATQWPGITGRSSGRYGVLETDDEDDEVEEEVEQVEDSSSDDDLQQPTGISPQPEAKQEPREGLSDAPIPNVPSWLTAWGTLSTPQTGNRSSSVKKTTGYNAPPPPPPPPRQLPPLPNVVGAAANKGQQMQMGPLGPPPLPPLRCPSPPPVPPAQTTRPMRTSAVTAAGANSKVEDTPKFAIRPLGAAAQATRNDYYAALFPSSWSQQYQPEQLDVQRMMVSDSGSSSRWSFSPPPLCVEPTVVPPATTRKDAESVPSKPGNVAGGQSLSGAGVNANATSNSNSTSYLTSSQRMSHFFNSPVSTAAPWSRPPARLPSNFSSGSNSDSNSDSSRDLPNPYGAGSTPNSQYTDSTLPKDRTVPPPAPPPWDSKPPQRRLRFAPLPPTPGYRPGPPPVIPPFHPHSHSHPHTYVPPLPIIPPPLPPPPPPFIYQTPVPPPPPVIPPAVPVVPPPPSLTGSSLGANSNLLSSNNYPSSKRYWFSDATVIFRVENCLYRVHRHFFELHSMHLSRLLAGYWYTPSSHFFLPDVKKVEFERLLSIFYPSDLAKSDITTVSGWTSILELSNKWAMPQVKALAIQKLTPLTTAVEKIAIAKKHALPLHEHREWLIPAYTELCARRTPLTLEEAEDLDLPTVLKVWEVQHAVMGSDYSCSDDRIRGLVKEKFGFVDGPNGSNSGGGPPFFPRW